MNEQEILDSVISPKYLIKIVVMDNDLNIIFESPKLKEKNFQMMVANVLKKFGVGMKFHCYDKKTYENFCWTTFAIVLN